MSNLLDTLNALPRPAVTNAEIEVLIAKAQGGDNDAALAVLREHMGIMVSEIARATRLVTGSGWSANAEDIRDDVTSDALMVFFRALEAFDPTKTGTTGFGGILKTSLRRDERMTGAISRVRNFRIPGSAAIRRAAALKEAGGDVDLARTLVKKHGITVETFDAINRVYMEPEGFGETNGQQRESAGGAGYDKGAGKVPRELQAVEPGYVRIEDLEDVARALDGLDFTSRMIVESAFGLNGQPQQSNAEIGESLGITRWAVQRRLDAAMLVMRNNLTDDNQE